MEITYVGNKQLLKLPIVAFLSSRKISSEALLRCYDWASEMRDKGACVISGFHSKVEKDVLTFLLKGKQPIIVVLGRAMYKKTPKEWIIPLREKRLLIITTNSKGVRYSVDTAEKRNRYITEISDKVVFGCLNINSSLYPLYTDLLEVEKEIEILNDL